MVHIKRFGILGLALLFIIILVVLVKIEIIVPPVVEKPIVVSYSCDASKTIIATYYKGDTKPATNPGMPPTPGGSVFLKLSDGREVVLLQTLSADGTRYADTDESFIFWSKGNGLVFTENNEMTYTGCITVASDPGNLPEIYSNATKGFSIRYPEDFVVDDNYLYQEFEPNNITGVKFTISTPTWFGTNLSSDTYISVEQIPNVETCTATLFLYSGSSSPASIITDGDTTYSVASSSDAGAGNRYEETVYALPGTNPCVAVRYNIHYSVFENYPAGTVKQFDQSALLHQFDKIRHTLILNQ